MYADPEKFRKQRREHRKANYRKCPGDPDVKWSRWHDWEVELVMRHDMCDREISRITGRSVQAIQVKRCEQKRKKYRK